ncbi:MbcA/ParS/Xre antitoxin family protein [Bradyrhizobium elkanii]|uniref:MbcA/ParS/Xre antitoxin family protein n=1 Tax=Bradyrhizobium elkanii TaxID=29448 RepID=UPI003516BFED
MHAEASAVVTKAVIRAADRLKVSAPILASIIGVSEATVSRMKRGEFELEPNTKPFELAVLFVRLFRSLDLIAGGDDKVAATWLTAPNTILDARPIEKLQTASGLGDVIAYLEALEDDFGSKLIQRKGRVTTDVDLEL